MNPLLTPEICTKPSGTRLALKPLHVGLPLLVLAISLVLTGGYWRFESQREQALLQQAFESSLHDLAHRFELQMASQRQVLQGLQGFLAAHPQADEGALRLYVQALPQGAEFAGLQGLMIVRAAGQLGPGDSSDGVAPWARAESVWSVGPDVAKQVLIRQSQIRTLLEQARDQGRLLLSDKLYLRALQLGAGDGYLQVLPVYKGGGLPATVPLRREQLQVWVVAPVDTGRLFSSLYAELPEGLNLALYDGQRLQTQSLLFRSAGRGGRDELSDLRQTLHSARKTFSLGGQDWTLVLQAGPQFARIRAADVAWMVPWVGGLLGSLLALLLWMMLTSRERAHALAERMTEALRESEQRWAFALEGAGDGVWEWNVDSGLINCSQRWKAIMGLPPGQEFSSMNQLRAAIHPQDLERVRTEFQHCLDGFTASLVSEYRVAGAGGAAGPWNWVLSRGMVVERDALGQSVRMVGTLSDINLRRQSEERLRFMALHDPLTELANRAHFDERFRFALANARRYQERVGLILLDLDRFKPINDQYGHGVGDQLLQTVAKRIRSAVRETDTVGRIGGDEFVVLLTGAMTAETAQLVVEKIFNQVAMPMELGGVRVEVTCSLGLAMYPRDGLDELSLAKSADEAMYRNKREGRALMGGPQAPQTSQAHPPEQPQ
ncbi:diguanylate cyclase domain-containing protein [Roseateles koreensis]|uniref:Diguanylate cyclase n=1 Tax=Roseateles koreensis TaxID=2987526 RepID=A0ABT5KR30_9BURK|nr:diguanylate cyclase [Roseateles koreensis]MDC8784838.1 diguanylate cyclase [Roseateles koreensis]